MEIRVAMEIREPVALPRAIRQKVQHQPQPQHALPPAVQIFVQTKEGKTTVGINGSMTVAALKAFLQDEEGFPHDQQILVFDDTQLEDFRPMCAYGIKDRSTVRLVLRGGGPIPLHVMTADWGRITLNVEASSTIGAVAAKIREVAGFAAGRALTCAGQQLKQNRTLSDYNIQQETTLCESLRGDIKIFIDPGPSDGVETTITLDVVASSTFAQIKAQIQKATGLPQDKQRLSVYGTFFELPLADWEELGEYSILSGASLHVRT